MPLHASVLKYFDMVVRLGSIRQAADRLNVASSAINRQIIKLEKYLGTPLFERLPRGMRLTPAGEVLIGHVRNTLRDFDAVLAEIEDFKGSRKGIVAVAADNRAGKSKFLLENPVRKLAGRFSSGLHSEQSFFEIPFQSQAAISNRFEGDITLSACVHIDDRGFKERGTSAL